MKKIVYTGLALLLIHAASAVSPSSIRRLVPDEEPPPGQAQLSFVETWIKYGKNSTAYSRELDASSFFLKGSKSSSVADEIAECIGYLFEAAKRRSYPVQALLCVLLMVPVITVVFFLLASKRSCPDNNIEAQTETDNDAEHAAGLVKRAVSAVPRLYEGRLQEKVWWYPPPMRMYSKRELLVDRFVNVSGAVASWVAAPVLLRASYVAGDSRTQFIGLIVFSVGLVGMLSFSALFHSFSCYWRIQRKLLYLDHIGIDAMIIGCYTPIAIHYGSFRILAFVLMLGAVGIIAEIAQFVIGRHKLEGGGDTSRVLLVRIVRYLIMGWSVAIISPKLSVIASPAVLRLLLAGGLLCTFGILIFVQDWMEFHLPIWHVMIQAASVCFYLVNYEYLVGSHGATLNGFGM
jgi:hemolysin III